MVAEIKDTTKDTGKGVGGKVPGRTWRNITTGAAHDAVAEEAVTFVGDRTGIKAEAEVRKGVIVTTPTPPPPLPPGRTENTGRQSELSGWR